MKFRYIKPEDRAKIPDADFALPNRRLFPLESQEDVDNSLILIKKANITSEERELALSRLNEIAKNKGFNILQANMSKDNDLVQQLTDNILFNAETNDKFELQLADKTLVLQVLDIR